MAFEITQNDIGTALLNSLLGETPGLSNFDISLVGDGQAFGTFQNDPFGLESGVVLSTGQVSSILGKNSFDGGFVSSSLGTDTNISFDKLDNLTGSNLQTAVYRADLSGIGFDINSITIADNGSLTGGSPGRFSGFDLDAIKLSNEFTNNATEVNDISGLNVFDFSPDGIILNLGSQRFSTLSDPDLFGTINGIIDNKIATLGSFDGNSNILANTNGFISLGNSGQAVFNLTEIIQDTSEPLYLYIGEVGNNGELASGQVLAPERTIDNDLSTDFGLPGADDDTISIELEFDADDTAELLYFQFVFGSEEFVEFGEQFNDTFSLELNGFNFARLSDSSSITINNLVPSPLGSYHPDFIYNPVDTGPASSEIRLDGYTQPLTYVGFLQQNARNTLKITIEDTRDGLFDSAVFIKSGIFETTEASPIDPDDSDEDDEIGVTITPIDEDGNFELVEGEEQKSFEIVLNTTPSEIVTIVVAPDDQIDLGNGAGNPITVIFTPDNALIPQTITAIAVDDDRAEGEHVGVISFASSSNDSSYEGLIINEISTNINDSTSIELSLIPDNLLFIDTNLSQVGLQFTFLESSADFVNEVGIFYVDDEQGSINGITPNQAGYLQAVMERSQVISSALANNQFSTLSSSSYLNLNTSEFFNFYLVRDSTTDNVIANLATGSSTPNVLFGTTNANPNGFEHLQITEVSNNLFELAWEDSSGGADADFNDLIVQMEVAKEPQKLGSDLQSQSQRELIDLTQQQEQLVQAAFTVASEAAYDNLAGLYRIADESGTVIDPITGQVLAPGEAGYVQTALQNSVVEFNRSGTAPIKLEGGDLYAPYILADGNPNNAYFPYIAANIDGFDHIRLYGNNTFAFEDLPNGGDADYNDFVVSVDLVVI
ncbi:MAG: DUF4114 domain-containing protein [Symploca sp. SIO1C4]|uniref:DUF4114 domain-containing protein n=1 Tax=Symploca sp. SIO1C4 TaxID=2607765 RepID=A0A6B3N9P0_9CYAN|nr:DUF4114 domain-containing protein [Symploca sp. SIO1C4]